MRARLVGSIAALAALVTWACNDPAHPDTRVTATVHVTPDSVSIRVGHVLQMRAVAVDSAGDTLTLRTATWASSDTTIVVVSGTGLVTARSYGPVTISAMVDSVSGVAAVRVVVPVGWVGLTPLAATLVPGGGIQLTSTLRGVDGGPLSDRYVTWTSQAPLVAAASEEGLVIGAQVGGTSVVASSEGVTSLPTTITVTQPSFVSLAAGQSASHTCGLTAGGEAFCWGDNVAGALGNGTVSSGLAFATGVIDLRNIFTITPGGGFTCALQGPPAPVYCWGAGDHNKLGNGALTERPVPGLVRGARAAIDVAIGMEHGCLLTTDSLAYCWGTLVPEPDTVSGGLRFGTIVSGYHESCGIRADSSAYCWGVSTGINNPAAIPGGLKFVTLTMGFQHACGIAADSTAYCWGQNSEGQLGDGTTTLRPTPAPVSGGFHFAAIAAGHEFTCGLTGAGSAYCWGANQYGQLGSTLPPAGSAAPVVVNGGLGFAQLVAGEYHACGLTSGGVAYCWGYNGAGQVGDGTKTNRFTPVRVAGQP